MTRDHVPPHDLDAERAVIGAMLLSRDAVRNVLGIVTPADFYKPIHQHIVEAIRVFNSTGEVIDVVAIADTLRANGLEVDYSTMLEIQNAVPSISNAERYAQIVRDHSVRRGIIMLAAELTESAYRLDEPGAIVDMAKGRLAETALTASKDDPFEQLVTFQEFVRAQREKPRDWAIRGFIGRGERLLIVAPEGAGKGTLMRQIAIAVGGGLHPFTQAQCDPQPALYLDLENPAEAVAHQAELSLNGAARMLSEHVDAWILHREAGCDLRKTADQVYLERAMQLVRPVVLCIGPIYKAARKRPTEQWEDATLDLFAFLDEIRTRFNCALIMEHHAPKGAGVRELVPFGSSAWLRWPDYGMRLEPQATDRQNVPTSLKVGAFRGSRLHVDWPDTLVRGGLNNLPWLAGPPQPR